MTDLAERVRQRVLAEHRDLVVGVLDCADEVAATFDGPATDGRALATRLRERLASRGLLDRLPAVVETAVAATGRELAADPVAAPPYVAVTSIGPVLRGSTTDGRVVVTVAAFRVDRRPRRYVRTETDPGLALDIEFDSAD